jgi:hypothetical protein
MKKTLMGLLVLLLCLIIVDKCVAADIDGASLPKVHIKIINTIKGQNFALCLSASCYVMTAAHKPVIMDGATVDSIMMANMGTLQMYRQTIPSSCNVTVKDHQTITVSGKLVEKSAGVYVDNLKCSVTPRA